MKEYVLTDFNLSIDREKVFKVMDLKENSPVYEEVSQIYDDIKSKIYKIIKPMVVFRWDNSLEGIDNKKYRDCKESIYVIATLGEEITDFVDDFFKKGYYLEGFLTDTIADHLLFKTSNISLENIKQLVEDRGYSLSSKLSPGTHIPMKLQKDILDKINSSKEMRFGITDGYMLRPAKSLAYIFGITKEKEAIDDNIQHDCKACKSLNCSWRNEDLSYEN